jgi:hypothetical protein
VPEYAEPALKLLCALHLHDWNKCKCRRCGCLRNQFHDLDLCTCKLCGRKVHEFIELDSDLHTCKRCQHEESHVIEYFTEVREVPGIWSSDFPYFIQDVQGHRCNACSYEVIDWTGVPR